MRLRRVLLALSEGGPGPTVRAAGLADLPRIVEIDAAAFPTLPYPDFFFRQAIDALGGTLRVVESPAGEVAGYALAVLAAGERAGWVLSMAIAPDRRGAGLAKALLDDVVRDLRSRGAREVRLTVEPDNAPALRLYARSGFQPIGDSADHFGPGERRLILSREA